MRWVIIDDEGASRAYFGSISDLLHALDEIVGEDPGIIGEFAVLAYDHQGNRVGDAIEAKNLVPRNIQAVTAEPRSLTYSSGIGEMGETQSVWTNWSDGRLQPV